MTLSLQPSSQSEKLGLSLLFWTGFQMAEVKMNGRTLDLRVDQGRD
jgi:hypothetical protein